MGALLRYLTTGKGADLILICNGEFFFVHKTVLAANSPILKKDACSSTLFDGEAFLINDVSPDVLQKMLTFLYRGEVPESCQKSWSAPSANVSLEQKFPVTDKFLTTVKGKPNAVSLNDGTKRVTDSVTNKEKWAIMLEKQAAMMDPFNMAACRDYAEVMFEMEVYTAAEKLGVFALKETAISKVSAWFEADMQTGLPLSTDVRTCAVHVLRERGEFAKTFIGLYAKYLPIIEGDRKLASSVEELHPIAWNAMMSVRFQWTKQLKQCQDDLEKSKKQISTLKTTTKERQMQLGQSEKELKERVETMTRSLVLAEGRADAANLMVSQLENLTRSLQQDLLVQKSSALQLRDSNRALKSQNSSKPDASSYKLAKKVEELERAYQSKETALEQSRESNQQIKTELREENEDLRNDLEQIKLAFTRLVSYINQKCPSCHRAPNARVKREDFAEISITCHRCTHYKLFDGERR